MSGTPRGEEKVIVEGGWRVSRYVWDTPWCTTPFLGTNPP